MQATRSSHQTTQKTKHENQQLQSTAEDVKNEKEDDATV